MESARKGDATLGMAQAIFAVTLDGGYGGKTLVACLDPKGDILDLVEA